MPSAFVAHGVGGLQQSRGELPAVVWGLVNDTLRSWVDRRGRSAKNTVGRFYPIKQKRAKSDTEVVDEWLLKALE